MSVEVKEKTGENYKFFQHKDCEFFPCHRTNRVEDFNCLFCYCPLYVLGEKCGGNYSYTDSGIKDCSECMVPHRRNSFDYVNKKFKEIMEIAKKK